MKEPPVDRMVRPEPGRLCCLVCQLKGSTAGATGDRRWAEQHLKETGHNRFAGVEEHQTRG